MRFHQEKIGKNKKENLTKIKKQKKQKNRKSYLSFLFLFRTMSGKEFKEKIMSGKEKPQK